MATGYLAQQYTNLLTTGRPQNPPHILFTPSVICVSGTGDYILATASFSDTSGAGTTLAPPARDTTTGSKLGYGDKTYLTVSIRAPADQPPMYDSVSTTHDFYLYELFFAFENFNLVDGSYSGSEEWIVLPGFWGIARVNNGAAIFQNRAAGSGADWQNEKTVLAGYDIRTTIGPLLRGPADHAYFGTCAGLSGDGLNGVINSLVKRSSDILDLNDPSRNHYLFFMFYDGTVFNAEYVIDVYDVFRAVDLDADTYVSDFGEVFAVDDNADKIAIYYSDSSAGGFIHGLIVFSRFKNRTIGAVTFPCSTPIRDTFCLSGSGVLFRLNGNSSVFIDTYDEDTDSWFSQTVPINITPEITGATVKFASGPLSVNYAGTAFSLLVKEVDAASAVLASYVCVFAFDGTQWSVAGNKIKTPASYEIATCFLASCGSRLVIYAGGAATPQSGIFVYDWIGDSWELTKTETTSSPGTPNRFSRPLSFNGDVIAFNSGSSTVSNLTKFILSRPIVATASITTQPVGAPLSTTNNCSFSVTAVSNFNSPLSYQWQRKRDSETDFKDLPGETTATLTLTVLQSADIAADYRVKVFTAFGATKTPVISDSARPLPRVVFEGGEYGAVESSISVVVSGSSISGVDGAYCLYTLQNGRAVYSNNDNFYIVWADARQIADDLYLPPSWQIVPELTNIADYLYWIMSNGLETEITSSVSNWNPVTPSTDIVSSTLATCAPQGYTYISGADPNNLRGALNPPLESNLFAAQKAELEQQIFRSNYAGPASLIKKVVGTQDFVLGLKTNGDVFAWGRNISGALGSAIAENTYTPLPLKISTTAISDIAVGSQHVALLTTDGVVLTAGVDSDGRLGRAVTATTPANEFHPVAGNYSAVVSGKRHVLAISADDQTLYGWGANILNVLASPDTAQGTLASDGYYRYATPVLVSNRKYKKIATSFSGYFSAGIDAEGGNYLFAWGDNSYYQVVGPGGLITPTVQTVPALVQRRQYIDISLGLNHGIACDVEGTLFCWGNNSYSQFGNQDIQEKAFDIIYGLNARKVAAGAGFSAIIDSAGAGFSAGFNGGHKCSVNVNKNENAKVFMSWVKESTDILPVTHWLDLHAADNNLFAVAYIV